MILERPLPRGPAINTILKNVSQLYRGCVQPVPNPGVSLESDVLKTEPDTYTRPETGKNDNGIPLKKKLTVLVELVHFVLHM